MLSIYNTATRKLEPFEPQSPGVVRMYVCGMTVYDYCHIGHGRVLVVFDTVARCLRALGYELHYARNITDVDDKILARAAENGEDYRKLAERFIAAMHEDCRALGVLPAQHEPRATEHIADMVTMIQALLDKGYAYLGAGGDVYYEVSRFADYGKLSNQDVDQLISGARVAPTEDKKHPADFALWKAAAPREAGWDAPWSRGRPGWHIECSAMSKVCLGDTLDIHGGGPDLVFPHHENEIAQSEAANGCCFARTWMHVGAVRAAGGEDMSKSRQNFVRLRDALRDCHPDVLRYYLLSAHYRSPIDYDSAALDRSAAALERLYRPLRDHAHEEPPLSLESGLPYTSRFFECVEDDFNIPEALAVLFELTHELNRSADPAATARLRNGLRGLLGVLGLAGDGLQSFFRYRSPRAAASMSDEEIERLVGERTRARAARDYSRSDEIRQLLMDSGVYLEDRNDTTVWHRRPRS